MRHFLSNCSGPRPVHRGISAGQTPLRQTIVLDVPPSARNVPYSQLKLMTAACDDHQMEFTLTESPWTRCNISGRHDPGVVSAPFTTIKPCHLLKYLPASATVTVVVRIATATMKAVVFRVRGGLALTLSYQPYDLASTVLYYCVITLINLFYSILHVFLT